MRSKKADIQYYIIHYVIQLWHHSTWIFLNALLECVLGAGSMSVNISTLAFHSGMWYTPGWVLNQAAIAFKNPYKVLCYHIICSVSFVLRINSINTKNCSIFVSFSKTIYKDSLIYATSLNGVFPNWKGNAVNLANLENLINHWSMNWGQFRDPLFTYVWRICGNMLISYTRGCRFE